ncbi:hypothetical protein ACFLZH_04855, partial [Patescibacteria group bacterium]
MKTPTSAPNFNPMFYSRLVYKIYLGGSGPAPKLKLTPAEEKAQIKIKFTRKTKAAALAIKKIQSYRGKSDPRLTGAAKAARQLSIAFNKATKGRSLAKVKEIERQYLVKLKKGVDKIKETIEAEKMRDKLLTALKLHVADVRDEFNKEYKTYNKTQKKYVERYHLNMLLNAYLLRWEKVNIDAIKHVNPKLILLTVEDLGPDGKFKKGKMLESLKKAKAGIRKAVDLWLTGDKAKWRLVYKDRNWDTKYEKKAIDFAYTNVDPGIIKLARDFFTKGRQHGW